MKPSYTDKYFTKTANCVDDKTTATYGVFLRHDVICAVDRALSFLTDHVPDINIVRHHHEGALVDAETPLFSYTAKLKDVVELETMMLQLVGVSCISAYNAYMMSLVCPKIPFLDMHARHAAGASMVHAAAYGAGVGSKSAQMTGAKGFIGSSLDETAHFYGAAAGIGTMPHVLIGYAGGTVEALRLFIQKNPDDKMIVALVDYNGQEITDSIGCANWWKIHTKETMGKTLGVRLDTHGGRFAEDLDYDKSVAIVGDWLHIHGKWPIVRAVMGSEAFDYANDSVRDAIAKILFGTGVSVANIVYMRRTLDRHDHHDVQIVASSGFNLRKCRIMASARAPIDMIGTGSFLPETMSETYATADAYAFNGKFSVKVGRENVFNGVFRK